MSERPIQTHSSPTGGNSSQPPLALAVGADRYWPQQRSLLTNDTMRCLMRASSSFLLPLLLLVGPCLGQDVAYPPAEDRLRVLHSWKQLDFEFPDEATRSAMIDNGQFVPVNNVIIDVNVYDARTFVTVPRVRPGVPVTLATIGDRRNDRGEPLLRPFPDWKTNTAIYSDQQCDNSITSVFRTYIDECGRLWVLDSGRINAWDANATTVCDPKVLVYDLRSGDRLIGSFPVPRSLLDEPSLLVTLVVEVVGRRRRGGDSDCGGDAYAYIADTPVYRMLVFSLRTASFWRVNSGLFVSEPDHYQFTVNNASFQFKEGLFGMALSPRFRCGRRRLYFHGIASVHQGWVETSVLRNRTLWQDADAAPDAFHQLVGVRPSQSVVSAMTGRGLLLFGLSGSNELACWDSRTPFGDTNIVRLIKDDEKLQFNTGMKLYKGKVHLVTNRMQNYVSGRVPVDEVNYRVLEADVRALTRGTACGDDRPSTPSPSTSPDRIAAQDYAPYSETVDVATEAILPSASPT